MYIAKKNNMEFIPIMYDNAWACRDIIFLYIEYRCTDLFQFFQVSYIVSIGIVDKLSGYCHSIRDHIDNKPDVAEFLLSSFQFLSSITGLVEVLSSQDQDPTHLWKAYEVTDLGK